MRNPIERNRAAADAAQFVEAVEKAVYAYTNNITVF
jgi:hypothetical protein